MGRLMSEDVWARTGNVQRDIDLLPFVRNGNSVSLTESSVTDTRHVDHDVVVGKEINFRIQAEDFDKKLAVRLRRLATVIFVGLGQAAPTIDVSDLKRHVAMRLFLEQLLELPISEPWTSPRCS